MGLVWCNEIRKILNKGLHCKGSGQGDVLWFIDGSLPTY